MFTIDSSRRTPVHAPIETVAPRRHHAREIADIKIPNDLVLNGGHNPLAPAPVDEKTVAAIQRMAQDLSDADAAIAEGRVADAHDALIHAQDIAFDVHLTLISASVDQRRGRPADIHLQLVNRLIDANRSKDPAIIAECHAMVEALTEIGRSVGTTARTEAHLARKAA